uniref:SURP motif domain-containing protein n=1 Tax=Anopheles maculatus TaxID=74869 RepID=A0A182SKE1_9DIPT
EARKRETLLGNQVPFNYDAPLPQEGATVATVEARTSDDDQDDDPYKVPKGFDIPPDIPLPESMKEHTVIEKTAKFIASQGGQMEILLKTKQANNPLFDFLNQSGRLFRYYRHVLLAFRTNQYPTVTEQQTDEQKEATANDENGNDSGEPSESAQTRPKIIVPAIKYKPSVDCAYTQLISKITGAPIPTMIAEESNNVPTTDGSASAPRLTTLNADVEYYPEGTTTTTTASVEVKKVSTGLAGLVQYDSDSGDSDGDGDDKDQSQNEKKKTESPQKVQELAPFQGIVPPLNIHNVIDRTAIYVAKNGYSFEEALRAKNDARFVFLNQAHEYYPYYAYRVRQRMMSAGENGAGMHPPSPPPAKVRMETENGTVVETTPSLGIKAVHTAAPKSVPVPQTNIQHQKLGAPVSFSLVTRKPKDDGGGGGGGGAVKTMPGLGSDEEEVEDKDPKQQDVSSKEQNAGGEISVKNSSDDKEIDATRSPSVHKEDTDSELLLLDGVDVLEATSPPSSSVIQRSDREPNDAKEKQAERKKRANMFVNLIKHVERKVDVAPQEQSENTGSQVEKLASISKDTVNSDVEAEEGSIHSVRSTSISPPTVKTPSGNSNEATTPTPTTTTVIEDDDDDDVVLVSETRPKPNPRSRSRSHADYLSDTQRSTNGTTGDRRSKKKKSKSNRSTRVKKKSKKKSRSRSVSRSERSSSRHSRSRKRSRSRARRERTKSHSRSSSEDNTASRGDRVKRLKKSKRATRSRSISRSPRSRSRSRSKTKRSRQRNASSERPKRKHRSRSRSSRRNSDSEGDERSRRDRDRGQRRRDGHYEYDERYPPARARYWDC